MKTSKAKHRATGTRGGQTQTHSLAGLVIRTSSISSKVMCCLLCKKEVAVNRLSVKSHMANHVRSRHITQEQKVQVEYDLRVRF